MRCLSVRGALVHSDDDFWLGLVVVFTLVLFPRSGMHPMLGIFLLMGAI